MISTLAGVQLSLPTAELISEISARVDLSSAMPWSLRAYPSSKMIGLALKTGFDPARPIRLGCFTYPGWGASNWGYGHFLATTDSTESIRRSAFGVNGKETNPIKFMMDSPGSSSGEHIETDVFLFPPIPLFRVMASPTQTYNGLYLLTFVDIRYYWWNIPCPDFAINGTSTTWASLFAAISAALGTVISYDAIPAAYRLPSTRLNLAGEVIPPIIDAVCANVGMRLIRRLDGSLLAISYDHGSSIRSEDDSKNPNRMLTSGGELFLDLL